MTPEDAIVCLCTRQDFDTTHQQKLSAICKSQKVRWDAVFTTADQHHVSPLVHLNLSNSQSRDLVIPQAVLDKFKRAYIHNVFVKKGTASILEKLLALFAQKGIKVMLVKGEALNLTVYKKAWYTTSYDVDLVLGARRDEIDSRDHHEIDKEVWEFNRQRSQFKEHIECDYFEHHDVTMNNILPVNSQRMWQEARRIQVYGYDVYIMTPEDMLLAAAIQSCRKRFFNLKSLCDIATIIQRFPDLDWPLFTSKARSYKANTIVYTALLVTQITLGCRLPEGMLDDLRVSSVRTSVVSRSVRRIGQHFSLTDLFVRSESSFLGREFSWPLLLTYASYRLDLIGPKLAEIYRAWRKSTAAGSGLITIKL